MSPFRRCCPFKEAGDGFPKESNTFKHRIHALLRYWLCLKTLHFTLLTTEYILRNIRNTHSIALPVNIQSALSIAQLLVNIQNTLATVKINAVLIQ